jgi:CRP-like cAMP-binding protein
MAAAALARYPLFRLLTPQQFDDWLAQGRDIDCAPGTTLFQENTPGAWIYLVRHGCVRIVREAGPRKVSLGMLQPGDVFGEYALLPPGGNTATCRTAAASVLLQLPLAPLRHALQERTPVWANLKNWLRLHTLLHFSRERAFLGFMSAESGLRLLDRLQTVTLAAGQSIQANGLAADQWHLIERGRVRLETSGGAEELGSGDAFGEGALIGESNLPVAVALSDVRCQVLARQHFDPSAPVWSKVVQSYQPQGPARPAAHVWVPQLAPTDCGLAALAMVSLRLGRPVSVEQLRDQVSPGPLGLTLEQLRELAEASGLACRGATVSAQRLGQVGLPAIAHLSGGHYVVLHELSAANVVVGDPAAGIVTWSTAYLAHCYTGSLLLF